MEKLNKRQIIILIVAVIFVLYAVYELLIATPAARKAKSSAKPVEISSFVSNLNNDLMKDVIAGVDAYIVRRAEADWKKSPFWDKTSYREWTAKGANTAGAGSTAKIIYSGYVDSGKKKMAIINGVEYRVGEQLEMEGYVLKNITPSIVLIVNKNTGSEITIPIQE
jgi:hypothetical protein